MDCLKLLALPPARQGQGPLCSAGVRVATILLYRAAAFPWLRPVGSGGWDGRKGEALWAGEAALCGPLADEGFCGIPQAASPLPLQ